MVTSTQKPLLSNRYILHEKLGEGGMAEVYRATHILLEREVAIKFINQRGISDPSVVNRFQQEARSVARLQHPNIMQVYDFDTAEDGRNFMAMEYLPGGDLQGYLRHKRQQNRLFTLFESIFIVKAAAEGLSYAHKIGVVHRDVKPSNIFIADETRVVIGDFGLAKMLESTLDSGGGTITGAIIGTPAYMSPEQAEGRWVDQRTDIYSLGIVLYEVLTGRPPYESDNTLGLLMKHLHGEIPNPCDSRGDLPPAANTIIQRALAKDPDARYPTMSALIKDLEDLAPEVDDQALTVIQLTPIPPTHIIAPTSPGTNTVPESHESGTSSRPSSATISLDLTFNWWTAGLVMAFVVLLASALVIALFLTNNRDDDPPPRNDLLADIEPAAAGEYLVVIADMQDTTTGVNISANIETWLETGPLALVLMDDLRVETLPTRLTDAADVAKVLDELGAGVVIWGRQDASGWQLTASAPNTDLQELRVRIPQDGSEAVALAQQLPPLMDVYSRVLLMDDLITNDDLFSALFLMLKLREIDDFENLIGLGATPYDQRVLSGLVSLVEGDYLAADDAATQSLAITNNAPSLLYFRWAANVLGGSDDLALRDVERLAAIDPDGGFAKGLRAVTQYLAGDLDAVLAASDDLPYTTTSTTIFAYSFIYQAQIQTGTYGEALTQMLAHRTWLQEQGASDADTAFLDTLAYIYAIQGDQKALLQLIPDLKDYRETRFYQEGNTFFRDARPDAYAPIAFSYGGFVEEVTGQEAAARLTYRFGLALHPDDYLLNWLQAGTHVALAEYQRAYDRYEAAVANAPAPFPIARYEQALLVRDHSAEISDPRAVCDLLAEAQTLAASDETFYAVLISQISATASAEGCN